MAGLMRRLAALLYDGVIIAGLLLVATAPVLLVTDGNAVPPGNILYQLYLFLVIGIYVCGSWIAGGQTLGMRAWRIKVETETGALPDFEHAVIRFLATWISIAPLGLGLIWMLFDRDGRALHDRLSRTRVVLIRYK